MSHLLSHKWLNGLNESQIKQAWHRVIFGTDVHPRTLCCCQERYKRNRPGHYDVLSWVLLFYMKGWEFLSEGNEDNGIINWFSWLVARVQMVNMVAENLSPSLLKTSTEFWLCLCQIKTKFVCFPWKELNIILNTRTTNYYLIPNKCHLVFEKASIWFVQ